MHVHCTSSVETMRCTSRASIRDALCALGTAEELRHALSALLERLYESINNYGFLAILVEPIELHGRRLSGSLLQTPLSSLRSTASYRSRKRTSGGSAFATRPPLISPISTSPLLRFDLVNEGFTWDCFVLASKDGLVQKLLLVFQKNERDETPVPCPTCRSSYVQGNSYSTLGVRSWECNNVLCPDRSKYNRGKRYAFRGLAMQQAIDDDRNEIPVQSVRRWTRDVVLEASDDEVAEMLVRHYSMRGDSVHVHNWPAFDGDKWGRRVEHHDLKLEPSVNAFWNSPLFRRYVVPSRKRRAPLNNLGDDSFQVLLGDSADVLRSLPESVFDGAVTSPPYYNARDYAQWPNMYCHLHDMFDINGEVYRTLKPGALYLYNVFDYFDNENTIVFSAMGQRRMVLSAYTVDLFRRIGFELIGNVVWDKGDIEGKRGFNAGNFSPYYQAPFNCWEHCTRVQKTFYEWKWEGHQRCGGRWTRWPRSAPAASDKDGAGRERSRAHSAVPRRHSRACSSRSSLAVLLCWIRSAAALRRGESLSVTVCGQCASSAPRSTAGSGFG